MTDDTSGHQEPTTRAPRPGTAVWIVIAVLGAALVFTSTLAVIQWRQAEDLRHSANVRRAAANTAAQFATALYTFDFNDLPGARARVLRFATAKYASGYDATISGQKDTVTRLQVREA